MSKYREVWEQVYPSEISASGEPMSEGRLLAGECQNSFLSENLNFTVIAASFFLYLLFLGLLSSPVHASQKEEGDKASSRPYTQPIAKEKSGSAVNSKRIGESSTPNTGREGSGVQPIYAWRWYSWFDLNLTVGGEYNFAVKQFSFQPGLRLGFSLYNYFPFSSKVISWGVYGRFPNFSQWELGGYVDYLSLSGGWNISFEGGYSPASPFAGRLFLGWSVLSLAVGIHYLSDSRAAFSLGLYLRIPLSVLFWDLTFGRRPLIIPASSGR